MALITGSINLSAFNHVVMEAQGKKGKVKGIFIPLEANRLKQSDKGEKCVYLNIVGFEMKEKKEWATHIVKQSLSKEVRDSMTEEEVREMPILGNFDVDNTPGETSNDAGGGKVFDEKSDLPF